MSTQVRAAQRHAISAAMAAALAFGSYLGAEPKLAVIAALSLVFAWGWPHLLAAPAPRGSAVLLTIVALASCTATYLLGDLRYLAIVGALSVIAAFVRELLRRDGRPRLVDSLAISVTGIVALLSAAGWAAVGQGALQLAVVLTTAVSLAAAGAVTAIPLRGWWQPVVSLVVATLAGVGCGVALTAVGPVIGGVLGFVAGVVVATIRLVVSRYPAAGRVRAALAAAAIPILAVGIPVYAVVRVYLV